MEKQTRNKNAPNKSKITATTESNGKSKYKHKTLIQSYFIITYLDFSFTLNIHIVNLLSL